MKIENLGDLQVLVKTAKEGSLTAAAKVLKITPAAASAMLKRLESQLGTQLFVRSTRTIRLTSRGQILLKYVEDAFGLIVEGEARVCEDQTGLSGALRVTAPIDLVRSTLLPWFDEFLQLHSKIELDLIGSDTTIDILRREIDVAIRYGRLNDSGLIQRNLAFPNLVLAASPRYLKKNPVIKTPQDLRHHNCLLFNRKGRSDHVWRFAKKGKWTEVSVYGDRFMDDATLAHDWAVAGAGLVLLSSINLYDDIRKGRLLQVLAEWDTELHPLHAVMPSGSSIPTRVRVFVDFLADKFAAAKQ